PADGIGAAVKDVRGGHAACKVAVDVDVVGIQYFCGVGDGGDRDAAFIHAAVNGDMRVAIDDAGNDKLALGIDHRGVFGSFDVGADFGDLAVLDEDRAALDGALGDGQDGSVLNDDDRAGVGRRGPGCAESTQQGQNADSSEAKAAVHRASP